MALSVILRSLQGRGDLANVTISLWSLNCFSKISNVLVYNVFILFTKEILCHAASPDNSSLHIRLHHIFSLQSFTQSFAFSFSILSLRPVGVSFMSLRGHICEILVWESSFIVLDRLKCGRAETPSAENILHSESLPSVDEQ